jgi:hypothetical protein
MNDAYFSCETCKVYLDAGHRWCWWTLEKPGVVSREIPVDVSAVLARKEYWAGEAENAWLAERLPKVHRFLEAHALHRVEYGDRERVFENNGYLSWLCEDEDELLPRYFVERLGYTQWEQVRSHLERLQHPPWWSLDEESREAARVKFQELVAAKAG